MDVKQPSLTLLKPIQILVILTRSIDSTQTMLIAILYNLHIMLKLFDSLH